MNVKIEPGWKNKLETEFSEEYFKNLVEFVKEEYRTHTVYPPGRLIFNAFDKCPLNQVKVVIIGQDPYHGHQQANGLCFSVNEGVKKPPSLVNIYKELANDLQVPFRETGNLEHWAGQGVLLLNATLTVRASSPGSHQNKGWEIFTDAAIRVVNDEKEGVVFILWGSYAQKKGAFINRQKHLVIESAHPSPFAAHRGFFGSKPFSKANAYLEQQGQTPIEW
jgi:uracil-DNA glycosylase